MNEHTDLSVIKLFKLFESKLRKINTYPLTPDNLVIQQDAYKRLASITDETDYYDDERSAVFAVLDYNRRENDRDLCFSVAFTANGYVLGIDGIGDYVVDYWEGVKSEVEAVERIVAGMQMLASGQLAVLVTSRGSYSCAAELLLYEHGSNTPKVIRTVAKYPRWWRKDAESGYETRLLRNDFPFDHIKETKRFFFFRPTVKGTIRVHGRILDGELTPLTKGLYKESMSEVGVRYMGGKEGELPSVLYYKSWEFWAITIGFVAILGILQAARILQRSSALVALPLLLIFIILRSKILMRILVRKQYLREYFPDHPWIRFENKVARFLESSSSVVSPVESMLPKKEVKHTRANQEIKAVAQKFPLVYAFAAATIILNIVGVSLAYSHGNKVLYNAQFSSQAIHQMMIVGTISTLVFYLAITGYLIFSKNFRGVFALLKVLLVFDLFGLLVIPLLFFDHNYAYGVPLKIYTSVSAIAQTGLLIVLVRQLWKAKAKEYESAPPQPTSPLLRKKPDNFVPQKPLLLPNAVTTALKVLLRFTAAMWALILILIGAMVSFGPNAHLFTLGIPLILLGLLYLTPYYILNRNLTIAYAGILVVFTSLVILLLHIPNEHGLPAFATSPAPAFMSHPGHTFNITAMYAFSIFHATRFLIFVSLLLTMDAVLGIVKYAEIPDNVKQSIKVLSVSLVILSIFALIGAAGSSRPGYEAIVTNDCSPQIQVGNIRYNYCKIQYRKLPKKKNNQATQTVSQPPLQPNFTSTKYSFKIYFPYTPSKTDYSLTPDCGNMSVPYTVYGSSTQDGTETYTVYAYKWPTQDVDFTNMTKPALESTLTNYLDEDMQSNNVSQTSLKSIGVNSGHTLAEEAQFNDPSYKTSGYLRVFTVGNFEYDLYAEGLDKQTFENFANSFQFIKAGDTAMPINNGSGTSTTACVPQSTDTPSGTVSNTPTGGNNPTVTGNFSTGPTNNQTLKLQ